MTEVLEVQTGRQAPSVSENQQKLIERIVAGLLEHDVSPVTADELRVLVADEVLAANLWTGDEDFVDDRTKDKAGARALRESRPATIESVAAPIEAPPPPPATQPQPLGDIQPPTGQTQTELEPPKPASEQPPPARVLKMPNRLWIALGVIVAGVVVITAAVALLQRAAPTSAPPGLAAPLDIAPRPAANNTAVLIDGSPFAPQYQFTGDQGGSVYEIAVGALEIKGGRLTLQIGALPGKDAVYDYVRLVTDGGREVKVEAEDLRLTTGDIYSEVDRIDDGHWWLQGYGPFSGSKGLLIHKTERSPVLTTVISAPDGAYKLYIGSFKGDKDNGVFGLGVSIK